MKIKNLNPLELHIEKIVLALAVLGAGYLAYTCWSNPTLINANGNPDGDRTIPPENVEAELKSQLTQFKNRQAKTNELVAKGVNKPETGLTAGVDAQKYLKDIDIAAKSALPDLVLERFAPIQVAARETTDSTQPGGGGGGIRIVKTASPKIPGLVPLVTAEVFQGVVGNFQQGALLSQWDANVVRISAQYPMAQLRDAIRNFPPQYQVVVVTNAEWERSERLANGKWSEFKPIPALNGSPSTSTAPAITLPAQPPAFPLAEVVAKFNSIPIGSAPNQAQDFLRQIKANTENNLIHKLPAGFDRAPNQKPMFPEASTQRGAERQPADDVYGGTSGEQAAAPAAGGAGAAGGGAPAPAPTAAPTGNIGNYPALTAREFVDLVNYDDTMQPGREYKYRVRVSVYNPLYGWPSKIVDRLEEPNMAKVAFTKTDWVEVATPIKVDPTEYFFVTNAGGLSGAGKPNTVRVELFKRKLGVWYKAIQDEVPVGGQIGVGSLSLADKGKDAEKDFSTKFSVVDVVSVSGKVSGVVLTNVVGDLVFRNLSDEGGSDKYKELDKASSKGGSTAGGAAPAPGPAAAGG